MAPNDGLALTKGRSHTQRQEDTRNPTFVSGLITAVGSRRVRLVEQRGTARIGLHNLTTPLRQTRKTKLVSKLLWPQV